MKGKIVVDTVECKGCKLCVNICPNQCIALGEEINDYAYHYAVQINPDKCTACKLCAYTCPESAIEVYKEV